LHYSAPNIGGALENNTLQFFGVLYRKNDYLLGLKIINIFKKILKNQTQKPL